MLLRLQVAFSSGGEMGRGTDGFPEKESMHVSLKGVVKTALTTGCQSE